MNFQNDGDDENVYVGSNAHFYRDCDDWHLHQTMIHPLIHDYRHCSSICLVATSCLYRNCHDSDLHDLVYYDGDYDHECPISLVSTHFLCRTHQDPSCLGSIPQRRHIHHDPSAGDHDDGIRFFHHSPMDHDVLGGGGGRGRGRVSDTFSLQVQLLQQG